MNPRAAEVTRRTRETDIALSLVLDGRGQAEVSTGIGFLDHLLVNLALHAGMDLTMRCRGDLEVDDHHTVEDCALAFGTALDRALGDRADVARFGHAYAPLDDALARSVVDLVTRPFAVVDLGLRRPMLGALACENVVHCLRTVATTARITLHVDVLRGDNDHHRAEAAFKSLALALRHAIAISPRTGVPSTKGAL